MAVNESDRLRWQDAFHRVAGELTSAVDVLLENRMILPSAVMIFVGVDTMASLNRGRSKPDVSRTDFVAWANEFLIPHLSANYSAIELYSARCALIHSYGSESRFTREGDARQVLFAWGDASVDAMNALIGLADAENRYFTIHLTELANAFSKGIEEFWNQVQNDAEKRELLEKRAASFYGHMEALPKYWSSCDP